MKALRNLLYLTLFFTVPSVLWAQYGGTQSIFSLGVGARALGLGSACVALPQDPTTIYWNPAGLDFLEQKGITFFYTNLLAGADYNFVGYVHPTIALGTFGIGMLKVGVGDLIKRDTGNPGELGTFSFNQYEFLLSYGKQILSSLSVGMNVKIERQIFTGLGVGDTGVGADVAVFFKPGFTNSFLNQLSFGLTVQNAIPPALRPGEQKEKIPYHIRTGIAKPIALEPWGSKMILLLDFDKGKIGKTPLRVHLGTEYIYHNLAMVRMGINDGRMVFGAGAAYNMFQLDYSYASLVDESELPASHRVSLTINFGKTKTELIRIAKEKRMKEIEELAAQQIEWQRRQQIEESLEDGKGYFASGDYYRAFREFSQVLGLDEDNELAKEMLEKTNEKIAEEQNKRFEEERKKAESERQRIEFENYVNEHFQKGLKFFEVEDYRDAIEEWNLVLDRDPQNKLAAEWKDRALSELRTKLTNLIRTADNLAEQGKYVEAIRVLDEAKDLNLSELQLREDLKTKIQKYEKALSFWDLYRQGLTYYNSKNYEAAVQTFEQALKIDPTNKRVETFYQEAKARAQATEQKMTPAVRSQYFKGLDLYTKGRYEEALKIFEEIRQIQPYNKRILNVIDDTKERLERLKQQKANLNENQK